MATSGSHGKRFDSPPRRDRREMEVATTESVTHSSASPGARQ